MREAGQHDVFEGFELLAQGGVDARVGVTEEVGPPRADAIQVRLAVEIVEPGTLAMRNRNQRQVGRRAGVCMVLHLRARVPNGSLATG